MTQIAKIARTVKGNSLSYNSTIHLDFTRLIRGVARLDEVIGLLELGYGDAQELVEQAKSDEARELANEACEIIRQAFNQATEAMSELSAAVGQGVRS